MIKELLKYVNSKNFNVDIYNRNFYNFFNEYNKVSCANVKKIQELYNNDNCFEIPFLENALAWGNEKVFFPFTSTLVKIIETNKGRTSEQFHPLKEENWFSLNEKTKYYNGNRWIELPKYNGIRILPNGIHSLEQKSLVLEIQDNNLFDHKETIRTRDYLNREVDDVESYIKYLIPTKKGKILNITTDDYSPKDNSFDYLVFPLESDIKVKYDNKEYELNKQSLYFVKKGFNKILNASRSICIRCNYYEKKD